jgi:class 3 adenylate cyclase/tetratricopeptide (TPR) repeat protein
VNCSACGHPNRDQARFCEQCAAPLARKCSACGAALRPTAKFCDECASPVAPALSADRDPRSYTPKHLAEKILTTRSAIEGERKQVTILFADLQRSMDLSEAVDPEDWHKIMERFFRILTEGVHRFEGTVNQYTGDGIMALFGAPIAHEDHAARACYAALALQEDLRRYANELRLEKGISFSVRMGMNSGEVVVGKIGDDLRMDYTALGHTASLGARMEQIAEPGKCYLTKHTARLVEGLMALQDLGRMAVKGVKEPLQVYELQGIGRSHTRLDVSRARGFSKFVGRADEMAVLDSALERALGGNGQVVGIVAGPGVGKSRLCLEFVERCRARGIFVNEGHCPPHGKVIPYLPVLELFRGYFRVNDQDSDEEARRKIAGTLLLLDEGFRDTLPIVFEFLGVADPEQPAPQMDPEAKQRRLLAFMGELVRRQSERQPQVVLIDDLHWIDRASDAFVAEFAEAIQGTRYLFLVNFRPEYEGPWMRRSHYQQLPLLPLGREATDELLTDLIGRDPSLVTLRSRVAERTGGNPFFVEEVVQSLVEAGELAGKRGAYRLARSVERLEIPPTVQAVLSARIDRLAERDKQVLETAAVIGKSFSESVLARVSALPAPDLAGALSSLRSAELLYETALYPEAEYSFKHPLTHEVAYNSLLRGRRALLHADVARAIAELDAEKLDERAALLAYHWEAAGDRLEGARWNHRAAEWAGRTNAAEGVRHWQKVRELLQHVPESAETLALGMAACSGSMLLGWRLGLSDEEALAMLTEGRALAARSGDLRSLGTLIANYAGVCLCTGRRDDALTYLLEATETAERAGAADLEFAGPLATVLWILGRHDEALAQVERAIKEFPEGRSFPNAIGLTAYPFLLWMKGHVLTGVGRLEEARWFHERAISAAQAANDFEVLGLAQSWLAYIYEMTGDVASAVDCARKGVEATERRAVPHFQCETYTNLGLAQLLSGDSAAAIAALEHVVALARESRMILWEGRALAYLAQAYLAEGEAQRARVTADIAVVAAKDHGARVQCECAARLARIRVLLGTEGAAAKAEIEAELAELRKLIDWTGAESYRPFLHEETARLARLLGDGAEADRDLREAQRLFRAVGATGHTERIEKELGS